MLVVVPQLHFVWGKLNWMTVVELLIGANTVHSGHWTGLAVDLGFSYRPTYPIPKTSECLVHGCCPVKVVVQRPKWLIIFMNKLKTFMTPHRPWLIPVAFGIMPFAWKSESTTRTTDHGRGQHDRQNSCLAKEPADGALPTTHTRYTC